MYISHNVFLSYANNPLTGNPSKFGKIYHEIAPCIEIIPNRQYLELLLSNISILSSINNPQVANEILEELRQEGKIEDIQLLLLRRAYEAVYGYRDGFCYSSCPKRFVRHKTVTPRLTLRDAHQLAKGKKISIPFGRKCYECQQNYFSAVLDEIIGGTDYDKIPGFQDLLTAYGSLFKFRCNTSRESKHNIVIYKELSLEDPLQILEGSLPYFDKFFFQDYWERILAYSIVPFLARGGRKKLKRCPECGHYFVGHGNSQYCTSQCFYADKQSKSDRALKAAYQREYRRIQKQRKKKERIKAKIRHYISKGYSKKEAEEYAKDDEDLEA